MFSVHRREKKAFPMPRQFVLLLPTTKEGTKSGGQTGGEESKKHGPTAFSFAHECRQHGSDGAAAYPPLLLLFFEKKQESHGAPPVSLMWQCGEGSTPCVPDFLIPFFKISRASSFVDGKWRVLRFVWCLVPPPSFLRALKKNCA